MGKSGRKETLIQEIGGANYVAIRDLYAIQVCYLPGELTMQITYQLAQDAALAAIAFIGARNTAVINKHFRAQDESHLYPICGRFNATNRAIRKVRREFAECGMRCEGLEYAQAIDATLDRIISQES